MSYWDMLPLDLQTYIYEFDTTWIDVYNDLMKELLYRTPYWRVIFLDIVAQGDRCGRFENRREEIKHIANYWNTTYAGYIFPPRQKAEEEFLTDNTPNKYSVLFRDLNMLKTYNFIFNNNEVRLIRKNFKNPKTLAHTKRPENQHQSNTTA
tara:strand:- start:1371 stop:1823 length:453 start_codon:yes stop_codon:yes gene_type:complete